MISPTRLRATPSGLIMMSAVVCIHEASSQLHVRLGLPWARGVGKHTHGVGMMNVLPPNVSCIRPHASSNRLQHLQVRSPDMVDWLVVLLETCLDRACKWFWVGQGSQSISIAQARHTHDASLDFAGSSNGPPTATQIAERRQALEGSIQASKQARPSTTRQAGDVLTDRLTALKVGPIESRVSVENGWLTNATKTPTSKALFFSSLGFFFCTLHRGGEERRRVEEEEDDARRVSGV
jgi:hypothetical protein